MPPPSVSRRDEGNRASILCGILRGATLPRSRAVRSPIRARRCTEGWATPPPDDCTCRVKPKLKSPPPPPRRSADGLPHPCAARGAAVGLPHALPCPPVPHCRAPVPVLPPMEGGGGGTAPRRGGGGRGTTLSLTLALSLTPRHP